MTATFVRMPNGDLISQLNGAFPPDGYRASGADPRRFEPLPAMIEVAHREGQMVRDRIRRPGRTPNSNGDCCRGL